MLGVRYMTLTHSNTNNWADSSGDILNKSVKHHGGLNGLGRDIVREMNKLGMIVDVSHVADDTFWDVMETSRAPVFASHSSCQSDLERPTEHDRRHDPSPWQRKAGSFRSISPAAF